ncbi:C-C motif chemokine 5-like [Podarcis lilfordi]|uniref:C-C motif chemokine 5-like n=1 Tax=Podarcis lilfordi TaxID=74358 RepID=A0AA35LF33_9SAUR|nr:C-C motif chemokine 5-like [Podarcis lilfordi]
MKLSLAALVFLLLVATFALADASSGEDTKETQDEASDGSSHCCVKYNRKPIPLKLLVSYEYAGSTCPLPAIIFITKGNKRICTNPDDKWVKDLIRKLPPP